MELQSIRTRILRNKITYWLHSWQIKLQEKKKPLTGGQRNRQSPKWNTGQARWHMPIILALGRLWQENHNFEPSLGYIFRHCTKIYKQANKSRKDYSIHSIKLMLLDTPKQTLSFISMKILTKILTNHFYNVLKEWYIITKWSLYQESKVCYSKVYNVLYS